MKKNEYHISVVSESKTALDLLSVESGLSRQKIKQAMQKGCVWLERPDQQGKQFIQRLRRAKKILGPKMVLHFYYDEEILDIEPPVAKLVADERNYSIWNKPSGMLSQGTKWSDHCTIYRWSEKNLQPERPAFLVHRLDRAANGIILLAHKKSVAIQFSEMFQKRKIIKHYKVKVHGDFSVLLGDGLETKRTIVNELDGKKAISHFKVLEYDEKSKQSVLDVVIETGRKHQIRRHLSQIGYPIVGDRIYGNTDLDDTASEKPDLQLSAIKMEFDCPISGERKQYKI